MRRFELGLENALAAVYPVESETHRFGADAIEGGHLFLQRVLYRINREVLAGTLSEFVLEICPESPAPKKPRESI